MSARRALCIAAILAAAQSLAAAQDIKLVPAVDAAASNANWNRFKSRLLQALSKHDQKFVRGIIDSKIRNTSETAGSAEFERLWEPQSAESPLWSELSKVLFLGGVYVKNDGGVTEYCMPYVYYNWPAEAPPEAGAIIAKQVLLKAQPSAAAPTLNTLSYDVVTVLDWDVADAAPDGKQHWVKVSGSGKEGYVPEEQIRSPLEYRACFVNKNAAWRMTGFEVGE